MVKDSLNTQHKNHSWRGILTIMLLLVFIIIISRNITMFQPGAMAVQSADVGWVLTGLGLTGLTFLIAASMYWQLALKPIKFGQTIVVELASAVANRLLPSGLGGLGLHGVYLYKHKHSVADATAVVSINNLIGIIGHLSLLGIVLLITGFDTTFPHVNVPEVSVVFTVFIVIVAICLCLPYVRNKVRSFAVHIVASFLKYRTRPHQLLRAYGLAMLLTLCYVLILACCCQAVAVSLSLPSLFIVFSFGILAGTVTPTPGGLVGAEAGLLAGLQFYGVNSTNAIAITIMYRLLTYVLPLVPGALAVITIRKRQIL